MSMIDLGPSPVQRALLTRRVRLLATATITYTVIEAVIALTAGAAASSSALIGFGLDSVIEVIAAVAVREGLNAWRGDDCCPPTTALTFGSGAKLRERADVAVADQTARAVLEMGVLQDNPAKGPEDL